MFRTLKQRPKLPLPKKDRVTKSVAERREDEEEVGEEDGSGEDEGPAPAPWGRGRPKGASIIVAPSQRKATRGIPDACSDCSESAVGGGRKEKGQTHTKIARAALRCPRKNIALSLPHSSWCARRFDRKEQG